MADIDILMVPAPEAKLALYMRSGLTRSERPLVIMLHGAGRTAARLADWIGLLAEDADVLLADLPGHGRSEPVVPATLDAVTAALLHTVRELAAHRKVVLVGESLGGLVALQAAGEPGPSPIRGVIAYDPPMSTAKLWTLQQTLSGILAAQQVPAAYADLMWNVFGIAPGRSEERIYFPLIEKLRAPALIVTGDDPLFPPRDAPSLPCVIDEVDRYVLERLLKTEVVRAPGAGHLTFADEPAKCLPIVKAAIARFAAD